MSKQTFESFHCKKITPIVTLKCYLSDLFVLSWEMVIATSNDQLAFAHGAEHRYRAQDMEIKFLNSHLNKTSRYNLQLVGLAVYLQDIT